MHVAASALVSTSAPYSGWDFTTSHRFYGAPPPQLLSALGIVAGCTIGTSLFHAVAPHVRGLAGAIALGSLASFPAWGGIVLSATGPHLRVLPIAAVAAGATGLVFGSVLWYHGVRIDGPPAKEH